MKSDPRVLRQLDLLVTNELTAVDLYLLHGAYQRDWGLRKLAEHSAKEVEEERGHIEKLLARILFLGGTPDVGKRHSLGKTKDIPSMFQAELAVEKRAIEDLRETIDICGEARDFGTQNLAITLLEEEEEHLDWIITQQGLIDRLGLPNYLQTLV